MVDKLTFIMNRKPSVANGLRGYQLTTKLVPIKEAPKAKLEVDEPTPAENH